MAWVPVAAQVMVLVAVEKMAVTVALALVVAVTMSVVVSGASQVQANSDKRFTETPHARGVSWSYGRCAMADGQTKMWCMMLTYTMSLVRCTSIERVFDGIDK
jgi:hypothetical protein